MKKIISYAAALLVLGSAFSGCYYDNYAELHPNLGAPCDTSHVMSYANDIVPILNNSCGRTNSCHNASTTSLYDFTNYSGTNQAVLDGALYNAITWQVGYSQMPKGSSVKISVCDQTKFKKWIDAGAPNN